MSQPAAFPRYGFRHALVREAAYRMLTADDRKTGHGLAAGLLEARGEGDPLALAEHWSRAGQPRRAVPWLTRAAQSALEASNLESALALAERGVEAGAAGEALGRLRIIQAQALSWGARWEEAAVLAEQVRQLVAVGSGEWFRATVVTLFSAMNTSSPPLDVILIVQSLPEQQEPSGPYARAMGLLCMGMVFAGQRELAASLLGRLDAASSAILDPSFLGWREMARATVSLLARGDLGAAFRQASDAISLLDGARDPVGRAMATVALARAQTEAGRFQDAHRTLSRAAQMTEQLGVEYLRDWARVLIGAVKNRTGAAREALALAEPIAEHGGPLTRGMAWVTAANAHFALGDMARAERTAQTALEGGSWQPLSLVGARTLLARVAMIRDQPAEALAHAEAGLALSAQVGDLLLEGSHLHLARATALRALDDPRALDAIAAARARIERVAEGIDDPEVRRTYLHELEPNVRTLQLAAAWCD